MYVYMRMYVKTLNVLFCRLRFTTILSLFRLYVAVVSRNYKNMCIEKSIILWTLSKKLWKINIVYCVLVNYNGVIFFSR